MFYITQNYVIGLIMFICSIIMVALNVLKGNYRLQFADLEKKYKKKNEKEGKKKLGAQTGKKELLL